MRNRGGAPAAPLLALLAISCGVLSPEEQLLRRFFEASRLHDTTAVARLASVTFNPMVEGVVEEFEVVDATRDGGQTHLLLAADVRTPDGRRSARRLDVVLRREGDRDRIVAIR